MTPPKKPRAKPLSPDERRAMILQATIPLLIEHGKSVTSKQIAEAAGIGEGTIFRVFKDKEALVEAAVERVMDPQDLLAALEEIDPTLPLREKVHRIISLLQERFQSLFSMMPVIGVRRPPSREELAKFSDAIEAAISPDAAHLAWPPVKAAQVLRMLAFASSPGKKFNPHGFVDVDELTEIALHGLCGTQRTTPPHNNIEGS